MRSNDDGFLDHYELLQISPNAEPETIQRVYRMLAVRYHPDNKNTGSDEKFKAVHEAYQVLSDSERRAQYDIEYHSHKTLRWKVFDTEVAAGGLDAEKGVRNGLLSVLYTKRRAVPYDPGVSLLDMEEMLGIPREHLEFSLWFLREKKFIQRTDDSRLLITAEGVEHVEESGIKTRMQKLLERPRDMESGAGRGQ